MRLILTILLIGLFKADAQMVINASAPYRPIGTNPLFDNFTGAAAGYSLRKLRTAYTGSAIRVRKDTTGQPEQDIGFLGSGELDTVSLKNFLNARSGFVTRWYDQSTNGLNGTQTTQANQPRIALTGVIERQNTKPTVRFDGSNDNLSTTHVITYPFSTFTVSKRLTTAVISAIIANAFISNMGTTTWGVFTEFSLFKLRARDTNEASIADNTNLFLGYASRVGNIGYVALNGSARNNSATLGVSTYAGGTFIGGTGASRLMNGFISEVIIYHSDQESVRSQIETNINTFYGIY